MYGIVVVHRCCRRAAGRKATGQAEAAEEKKERVREKA